jgi:hypothetical protein
MTGGENGNKKTAELFPAPPLIRQQNPKTLLSNPERGPFP